MDCSRVPHIPSWVGNDSRVTQGRGDQDGLADNDIHATQHRVMRMEQEIDATPSTERKNASSEAQDLGAARNASSKKWSKKQKTFKRSTYQKPSLVKEGLLMTSTPQVPLPSVSSVACARKSCREGAGSAPNEAMTAVRGEQSSMETLTRVLFQASVCTCRVRGSVGHQALFLSFEVGMEGTGRGSSPTLVHEIRDVFLETGERRKACRGRMESE